MFDKKKRPEASVANYFKKLCVKLPGLGQSLFILTIGVLPIVPRMLSYTIPLTK